VLRSNHADVTPAIDLGGGDAETSQATSAELVPSPWGVYNRLCGGYEWQGEIDDEKSLWIQVVQSGGSRTPAHTWEAADPRQLPTDSSEGAKKISFVCEQHSLSLADLHMNMALMGLTPVPIPRRGGWVIGVHYETGIADFCWRTRINGTVVSVLPLPGDEFVELIKKITRGDVGAWVVEPEMNVGSST